MCIAHGVSQRAACHAVKLSRSMLMYRPVVKDDQPVIAAIERHLAAHPRDGFGLLYDTLSLAGRPCGKTRLWRVYFEMKLNVKWQGKKRLPDRMRVPLVSPASPNDTWSADFMADALWNGRRFRTFNILDDYNREALRIEIDTSLPASRVVRAFNELIEVRGKPATIRLDNGPELISHELAKWATDQHITLQFIQKGRPTQNAYIERFNRTYRQGVLDCYVFNTLDEVRAIAAEWLEHYNHKRPHESLGRIPPKQYAMAKPASNSRN
jgi:putative transposase